MSLRNEPPPLDPLENNAGNKIVSNSGWGILCDGPPANPLIAIGPAGTVGTVSGNAAGQIACNIAP